LAFCEQLVVIDLGSEDQSVEIARECGADVVHHEWVPVVEQVWRDVLSLARNDWIIRSDPDEVFPPTLVDDLFNAIAKSESLAMVSLPYQYYFRGRPLRTTIWGGIKYIPKVFHKGRVELEPYVHRGIRCRTGYHDELIKETDGTPVQHFWADDFGQLLRKHWRYIGREGEARYQQGERFSWHRLAKETIHAFRYNLIDCNGVRGGLVGIFLSAFYAWYVSMSLLSLRRCQERMERGTALG
jgi:glycosyltransferase involved in cell wall biosynthesis